MSAPASNPMIDQAREAQIAAGTVMLTARELAPRIGLHHRYSWKVVIARAKAGRIPVYNPNERTFLFHWPTVVESLAVGKGKGRR